MAGILPKSACEKIGPIELPGGGLERMPACPRRPAESQSRGGFRDAGMAPAGMPADARNPTPELGNPEV